jgi:hypothetical protein
MQLKNLRSVLYAVAVMVGLHGSAIAGNDQSGNDQYRVSRGEIVVVCPLTVGGGFEAKS